MHSSHCNFAHVYAPVDPSPTRSYGIHMEINHTCLSEALWSTFSRFDCKPTSHSQVVEEVYLYRSPIFLSFLQPIDNHTYHHARRNLTSPLIPMFEIHFWMSLSSNICAFSPAYFGILHGLQNMVTILSSTCTQPFDPRGWELVS